jgi:sterol 3beta-glucosyltransferase
VRVTLMVVGSTGDVRPMVALGAGLRAAGHQVRLATHAHFRDLIEGQGLEFWPIAGNPIGELSTEAGRGWLASGTNPVAFARLLGDMARDLAAGITRDCLAACTGCDAIVGSLLGTALAWQVGEKLGIPVVPAYLQPRTPTSYYPDLFFPELFRAMDGYAARPGAALRLYHRISYRGVRWVIWRSLRESVNIGRELLGLPRLSRSDHFGGALDAPRVLYGFSPLVAPAPPDWGPDAVVTGYWVVNDAAGWTPPPALVDFLQNGEPPIYIGFGSMVHSTPEDTADMVLSALARLGRRGVVSTGWGGMRLAELPKNVFAIDFAPHEWLFARVAAVVHHGGAGTTAAGLRAGKPSIITPFFADQNFWGRRVHALGAGPRPVPVRRLSTETLAAAIDAAARSADMRRRAEDLGGRLREEKGVESAVVALERMVSEWPGWDRVRRRDARRSRREGAR